MKIIRSLISLIYLFTGSTKLFGTSMMLTSFVHWGYPLWLMYVIGICEVLAAIGIWIPKVTLLTNVALIVLMACAFYTHLVSHDSLQMMGLAIFATILVVTHLILYIKKHRRVAVTV